MNCDHTYGVRPSRTPLSVENASSKRPPALLQSLGLLTEGCSHNVGIKAPRPQKTLFQLYQGGEIIKHLAEAGKAACVSTDRSPQTRHTAEITEPSRRF